MAKPSILTEAGTNELEVLVFSLGDERYGVNVAKVREVIEPVRVTSMPESHAAVPGLFRLRDHVIPLIDLRRALGDIRASDLTQGKIIVMEFNDTRVGFFVDAVEQIHRVNWKSVAATPELQGVRDAPLTSIAFIRDRMILMLDFERIVFEIAGFDLFAQRVETAPEGSDRNSVRILFAEDSRVMRNLIQTNLVRAGYSNVTLCNDGALAWEALERDLAENGRTTFDLLITDIEMPGIDGLHLTKKLKENPSMKQLPVVIFSSIVSIDNEKKCQSVGADAQITKPQLAELVTLVERLVAKARANIAATGGNAAIPRGKPAAVPTQPLAVPVGV